MKRTPLIRKIPLQSYPARTLEWKRRSQKRIHQESTKRKHESKIYHSERQGFLDEFTVCPVTGERTTQIHHSARRYGQWLTLKLYWIGMSSEGHRIVEENKKWAESVNLIVRIPESYDEHIAKLVNNNIDLDDPVFYLDWNGEILIGTIGQMATIYDSKKETRN